MAVSLVSDPLVIQSHRGQYAVTFDEGALARLGASPPQNAHFIVDARVLELHRASLGGLAHAPSILALPATEAAKSLDKIEGYVEHLLEHKARRSDILIAIGGGIIQDITCFLATTVLRGLEWRFFPTTLLAQADSCIGSKSSLNVGKKKNLLGTFYPPREITVSTTILETLDPQDMRSGVGEMLKVHAIDGPDSFDTIASDYARLFTDTVALRHYIRRSLELKKRLIELDEFDRGPRNVMNYGHSFGHAIESATAFAVPHGIAVTIGMDLANYVSAGLGIAPHTHFGRMHPTLAANYANFEATEIPAEPFFDALDKDKKNTTNALGLILPDAERQVRLTKCKNDETFRRLCTDYLTKGRRA